MHLCFFYGYERYCRVDLLLRYNGRWHIRRRWRRDRAPRRNRRHGRRRPVRGQRARSRPISRVRPRNRNSGRIRRRRQWRRDQVPRRNRRHGRRRPVHGQRARSRLVSRVWTRRSVRMFGWLESGTRSGLRRGLLRLAAVAKVAEIIDEAQNRRDPGKQKEGQERGPQRLLQTGRWFFRPENEFAGGTLRILPENGAWNCQLHSASGALDFDDRHVGSFNAVDNAVRQQKTRMRPQGRHPGKQVSTRIRVDPERGSPTCAQPGS